MYWNGYQWVKTGMTEFQKAMLAILIAIVVMVVGFVVVRSEWPCVLPLGNDEQFVCALQDELGD